MLITPREKGIRSIWLAENNRGLGTKNFMFVPVVERRDQKHLDMNISRRVRFSICRRSPNNRGLCPHERAVIDTIEEMEVDGLPTASESENNHDTAQFLNESGWISAADDEQDEVVHKRSTAEEKKRISYVSRLPHQIMPCSSDLSAMTELLYGVAGAKNIEDRANEKSTEKTCYLTYDQYRVCDECDFHLKCTESARNCGATCRHVVVHTLLHGSITADVLDLICPRCNTTTTFDGRDSALFSWSVSVVHSSDIIDIWLYQIAMLGGTFRAAYELSRSVSNTATASLGRLGEPLSCHRRQASDIFSAF